MLHVTNGDSAGQSLREGLNGEVLAWRDVLHDGPVPADLSKGELEDVRARFLADRAWARYEEVRTEFATRGATLDAARNGDEIVLWFEHDLYDQLQLIQILAWFADRPSPAARLSLICIDSYPGVDRFVGLGQLTSEQLAGLFPARREVTAAQLHLGRRAWEAFRSPDPTRIEELLAGDTTELPFLASAFRRHLQQFPSISMGLSRTEYQILEVVISGIRSLERIFVATQDLEESPFLGDSSLREYVSDLFSGDRPLLRPVDWGSPGPPSPPLAPEREVELTEWGRRVRARQADWILLRGEIDRWLGGVHLSGRDARWRWDPEEERLVETRTTLQEAR